MIILKTILWYQEKLKRYKMGVFILYSRGVIYLFGICIFFQTQSV